MATRVAGGPKVITADRNGLLCEPNVVSEMAACMKRVAASQGLRSSLAERARLLIEEQYGFANRMNNIAAIYDRIIEQDRNQS